MRFSWDDYVNTLTAGGEDCSGGNCFDAVICGDDYSSLCLLRSTDITCSACTFPTMQPTEEPTISPTVFPSNYPTFSPSIPTHIPTNIPTSIPTNIPSTVPTATPTGPPTSTPTGRPTNTPTMVPTQQPTSDPTDQPTKEPTEQPSERPTEQPTIEPSMEPTSPTNSPTVDPTQQPTEPADSEHIGGNQDGGSSSNVDGIILGVSIASSVVILVLVVGLLVYLRRRGSKANAIANTNGIDNGYTAADGANTNNTNKNVDDGVGNTITIAASDTLPDVIPRFRTIASLSSEPGSDFSDNDVIDSPVSLTSGGDHYSTIDIGMEGEKYGVGIQVGAIAICDEDNCINIKGGGAKDEEDVFDVVDVDDNDFEDMYRSSDVVTPIAPITPNGDHDDGGIGNNYEQHRVSKGRESGTAHGEHLGNNIIIRPETNTNVNAKANANDARTRAFNTHKPPKRIEKNTQEEGVAIDVHVVDVEGGGNETHTTK